MQDHLNATKDSVLKLVERLRKQYGHLRLHFGCVRYTDFDQPAASRTSFLQFTEKPTEFQTFVGAIKATGGGDAAEDVFGGLNVAVKEMDWGSTKNTNLLIHIADAPCHGSQYHESNVGDDNPSGDPNGISLTSLMKKIVSFRINYWFGKITVHTDKMIQEFNKELKAQGAENDIQSFDAVADPDIISKSVAAATAASISVSMSSKAAKAAVRPYALSASSPDWKKIKVHKAVQRTFLLPSYDDITNLAGSFAINEQVVFLKVAPQPFAAGGMRLAYHARQYFPKPEVAKAGTITQDMLDESTAKHVVVKIMKHTGPDAGKLKHYLQEVEVAAVAAKLAIDYHQELTAKRVRIDNAFVYGVAKVVTFNVDPIEDGTAAKSSAAAPSDRLTFNMETYIDGKYEKFNSNAGFVAESPLALEFGAFSHWTYAKTDGKIMVVDLQGVNTSRGIILTDPAVHALNLHRFGNTNLGADGFDKFFLTHKCGSRCQELGLMPPTAFR